MNQFLDAPATGWGRLAVEPRRPPAVRALRRSYVLTVAAVCIGAFMGQFDASVVTLALPALGRAFHADAGAVSWVGLSYLLVLVGLVAAAGRLSDVVGRKLVYVYGFAVFVAGSALCAAAPSLVVLDLCRAVQAVGAAMLQANSVAIIARSVPGHRLGRALGVQGAVQAVGLAFGPTVGGLLLAAGGWRLLFLVNVPVGVVGIIAGILFIPRSRDLCARGPFDWVGLSLLFTSAGALLFAISGGGSDGWASPVILTSFVASLVLAGAFVVRERSCRLPMVDLGLFSQNAFASGIAGSLLVFVVLFGSLVALPFYLERFAGTGVVATGLEVMVIAVSLGLTAPFAGALADRYGARLPAVTGAATAAAALFLLATTAPPVPGFLALLAAVGVGVGLFLSPNNTVVMTSAPPHQSGMAAGLLNMSRGLGTALGVAVTGAVFTMMGGDRGGPAEARTSFTVCMLVLAATALAVAVLAAASPSGRAHPPASRSGDGTTGSPELVTVTSGPVTGDCEPLTGGRRRTRDRRQKCPSTGWGT